MNDSSRTRVVPVAVLALLTLNFIATLSILFSSRGESRANIVKPENTHPPIYANFARVTGTPEEVIINFGHNAEFGPDVTADDIPVLQIVTMNLHTANRFAAAMQATIERHEEVFGKIER